MREFDLLSGTRVLLLCCWLAGWLAGWGTQDYSVAGAVAYLLELLCSLVMLQVALRKQTSVLEAGAREMLADRGVYFSAE